MEIFRGEDQKCSRIIFFVSWMLITIYKISFDVNPQQTFDAQFKSMHFIHLALMVGPLLFAAVVYYGQISGLANEEGEDSLQLIFQYGIPALAIINILMGRVISRSIYARLSRDATLAEKVNAFQTASILRWSLMEGVALFAVVAYMLMGQLPMLLVALAAVGYLFTQKPTKALAARELNLSIAEQGQL